MVRTKGQYPSSVEVAAGIFFWYVPVQRKNHNAVRTIAAPILPLAGPTGAE
jgi:hypothetical protein